MTTARPALTGRRDGQSLLRIGALLALALFTLWTYRTVPELALFNDDPTGHLRWVDEHPFPVMLASAEGYSYYRPLSFVIWDGCRRVIGHHDPRVIHGVNLAFHLGSVLLVWGLALRLGGDRSALRAWLAALLFALYPFGYEAVAYASALFHIAVTFFALVSVYLYDLARRGRRWAFVLAHIAVALALLSHESGLVVPVLILAWEVIQISESANQQIGKSANQRRGESRICRATVRHSPFAYSPFATRLVGLMGVFMVEAILFIVIWCLVPKGTASLTGETLQLGWLGAAVRGNVPFFLQALGYPLAPGARLAAAALPWLVGGAVVLVGVMARCTRQGAFYAWSLVWWGLASLPALLLLRRGYIHGNPHLYYFPAVGAAFLWAIPLAAPWVGKRGNVFLRGVAVLAALTLLWWNQAFINVHLGYFRRVSAILRELVRTATVAPAEKPLLYVNLPVFIGPAPEEKARTYPFPYGATGAVVIPSYARVGDFIFYNGGPRRSAQGVTGRDFSPGWATYGQDMELAELREHLDKAEVYAFSLPSHRFFPLSAHWQVGREDAGKQALASFGEAILLVEHGYTREANGLQVSTRWLAAAPVGRDYTLFVHLYAPDGHLVAQKDGPPGEGFIPTRFWQAGDVVLDERLVPLSGVPAGQYRLAVGWYDPLSGERLAAFLPDGERAANDVVIIAELRK